MEKQIKQKDKALKLANGRKTALVVRYGAIGDLVMITPVLRQLKRDGYFVVVNTHVNNIVLTCNPHIDAYILQRKDEIENKKLGYYWRKLSYGFDKFINLSESIEGSLLKTEGRVEFHFPKAQRHRECNVNYMDRTMELSGYKDKKGELPELFFSEKEHAWARKFLSKHKDKFIVLVSLSGSGVHKAYPYMEFVVTQFLDNYPDTLVITVGDLVCRVLEWQHPRTISMSGKLNLRKSLILTQYADLVVGTETGILNASSCFDTPKIVILSHSTVENLTKYWINCESIEPNVHCYPCHQLHHTSKSCPQNTATDTPLCPTMIRPEQVLIRMEKFYKNFRRKVA